jgi:hypothetical protein
MTVCRAHVSTILPALDHFSIDNAPQTLDFVLDGKEIGLPGLDHLLHRRAGGWELLLFAVVVEDGIVVSEQSVLNLDLCSQQMGQDGESGCD